MELSIDVNFLIRQQLTADQYLLLCLLLEGDADLAMRYVDTVGTFTPETFSALYRRGLIDLVDPDAEISYHNVVITDRFKPATAAKDLFEKVWEAYPSKTIDGRILRQSKRKCLQKFTRLIKDDLTLVETMLNGIKAEKKWREANPKQLPFWRMFETWLNNEGWNDYLNLKDDEEQDRYTRIL